MQNFCINMKNTDASPSRPLSGRIKVDGINCYGKRLGSSTKYGKISTARRDSVATSSNTRRPLTFGKQILTGSLMLRFCKIPF
jgi:hypothetical protein